MIAMFLDLQNVPKMPSWCRDRLHLTLDFVDDPAISLQPVCSNILIEGSSFS